MTEFVSDNEKTLLDIALRRAREAVEEESRRMGIGTLREKLLHRTLKFYLEPDESRHEAPVEGYVADVLGECGVIEIQTRAFRNLRNKIEAYLPVYPVTLVYPVVVERRVIWVDADSGEMSEPKRSPKKGRPSDVLSELSQLPDLLPSERLRLKLFLLCADEYRLADGRGPNRRRGATKMDIYPTELRGIIDVTSLRELSELMPALPEIFTAKQFYSAVRLRGIRASVTLSYVTRIGLVERIGKQGNSYLYSKKQQ